MSDWRKVLGTVAPWIGAAATGGVPALVGMAAHQLAEAFGGDVKASVDGIARAVAGATPEQMLALKQAEQEFQAKLQQMGFQNLQALEAMAVADRDSARKLQIATGSAVPAILAVAILLLFGSVMWMVLTRQVPDQGNMRDAILMMLGGLSAAMTQVLNFYLGSSAASERKNELLVKR